MTTVYDKYLKLNIDGSCIGLNPGEREIPEWKVYFDGNFWGHHGSERAGEEICINKQFVWDYEIWHIPAIYICSKGVIVDFCRQVPAQNIRFFMDKWNLSIENDGAKFTDEQRMMIDAENPLAININRKVVFNGSLLSNSHGCGMSWNPCFPDSNDVEIKHIIQHYNLDPAYGWGIWRAAFAWTTKRKPQMKTLSITLMQHPVAIAGPHFHVSAPGDCIEFTHPITGIRHMLTVQEYEQQELCNQHFANQNQELPMHYRLMSYTLFPALPDGALTVTDCVQSDKPRKKSTDSNVPQAFSSVGVCLIGGAKGPTAIVFGDNSQGKLQAACSALHYEPVEDVEWRMVFHEKIREDICLDLISNSKEEEF